MENTSTSNTAVKDRDQTQPPPDDEHLHGRNIEKKNAEYDLTIIWKCYKPSTKSIFRIKDKISEFDDIIVLYKCYHSTNNQLTNFSKGNEEITIEQRNCITIKYETMETNEGRQRKDSKWQTLKCGKMKIALSFISYLTNYFR